MGDQSKRPHAEGQHAMDELRVVPPRRRRLATRGKIPHHALGVIEPSSVGDRDGPDEFLDHFQPGLIDRCGLLCFDVIRVQFGQIAGGPEVCDVGASSR